MVGESEIKDYYDEFQLRLLKDYVHGNLRQKKALSFVSSLVTPETIKILDVGCGIGSSCSGLAELYSHIKVLGVDIGPKNITAAKLLHESDRVSFLNSDLSEVPDGGPFDLISMIDVYEHIPPEARQIFHDSINKSLGPDGTIAITTPSPLHQKWLTENEPEGLQIVDETILLDDLNKFASDVGGTLVRYEWVNVWRSNQYCYSVITRNPRFVACPQSRANCKPKSVLSRLVDRCRQGSQVRSGGHGVTQRKKKVRSLFGVDV